MRNFKHALSAAFAAMLTIAALPASAQDAATSTSSSSSSSSAAPKCTAAAPLPPEFAGFDAPLKETMALTPEVAPTLSIGTAYRLTLSPALGVAYIAAPKKPPEDGRYAGFVTFTIAKEGTYSIAASDGVWIDVYSGTEVVRSSTFGRVECSTIHKVVNFPLKAGIYKLQLSNAPVAAVTVMIAPKP